MALMEQKILSLNGIGKKYEPTLKVVKTETVTEENRN